MKFEQSAFELLTIVLENCETFEVRAEDVLEFELAGVRPTEPFGGDGYRAEDGRLRLHKRAFNVKSNFADVQFADGTHALDHDPAEDFLLGNRILSCCDVTQLHVRDRSGKTTVYYVPYDPLESILTGAEIDLSNCPSSECDENGDLLLLFGASSRSYHRTDNNYFDLVEGLREELGGVKGTLRGEFESFSNVILSSGAERYFISLRPLHAKTQLRLVFDGVHGAHFDCSFGKLLGCLFMSRISTGEIFVEVDGFCTFYCTSAKTYAVFAGRDGS